MTKAERQNIDKKRVHVKKTVVKVVQKGMHVRSNLPAPPVKRQIKKISTQDRFNDALCFSIYVGLGVFVVLSTVIAVSRLVEYQLENRWTVCSGINQTDVFELRHSNLYWQLFTAQPDEGMVMHLYKAYYDTRMARGPVVRILAVNDFVAAAQQKQWRCLLWFDNTTSPVLTTAEFWCTWPSYWSRGPPGVFMAVIITCPIPESFAAAVPRAVSLQTGGSCDLVEQKPSNVLPVLYKNEPKKDRTKPSIGVCVKASRLATYDVSVRLVEWLETVKLMGAKKVYFYVFAVNENMMKVIRYYEKEGLVDWRPLTLAGSQPNNHWLYNIWAFQKSSSFWPTELLELNDCLYRQVASTNGHDYMVPMDIDEMIVPRKIDDWVQLIDAINATYSEWSHLSNAQAYLSEVHEETELYGSESQAAGTHIPWYMYMMRHTTRAAPRPNYENAKTIVRTERMMSLHNHMPIRCISTAGHYEECSGRVPLEHEDSLVLHYRRATLDNFKHTTTSLDHRMWHYYDRLQPKLVKQLAAIFNLSAEVL